MFTPSTSGQINVANQDEVADSKAITTPSKDFKVELFRSAMKLGIPRSKVNDWGGRIGADDVTLEVATALGVDDVYEKWLQDAREEERQSIMSTVATYAAKYGRTDLALKLSQQLEDSSKKIEAMFQIAFLLGHESMEEQFQLFLVELNRMHDADAGGHDRDNSSLFEEHTLAQWRESFLFAYHSGIASSVDPIREEDLARDISTVLFRDSVRAFKAYQLMRDEKPSQALAIILKMESELLQVNLLHSLIADLPMNENQIPADSSELGKLLFEKYLALDNKRDYTNSNVFKLFEEFDIGEIEPIDGIPFAANELIREVFDLSGFRLESREILAACIESGFCKDGLRAAAKIENNDLRSKWLKSVLRRFETRGELEAAWETRDKYKEELGVGVDNGEAYLGQLVTLACRQGNFELADSFLIRIKDDEQSQDARFTIAAHRQNDEDLQLIQSRHSKVFTDFERELASVDEEEQLAWLYQLGLHSSDERQLLLLGEKIKREFVARKESNSRAKVARQVLGAVNSMTPLPQTHQRFMENLAEILGAKTEQDGFDRVLTQLENQKPDTMLSADDNLSILNFCVKARQTMNPNEADREIGKVAVAYAVLGSQQEVTKLIDLIENRNKRFYALLNCAMVFPPESTPRFQGRKYRDKVQRFGPLQ